jgi:hypothetical protein
MEAINRILVVLDPHLEPTPKAQPVIAKGLELAKALGAELHLTLTQYDQHLGGLPDGQPAGHRGGAGDSSSTPGRAGSTVSRNRWTTPAANWWRPTCTGTIPGTTE